MPQVQDLWPHGGSELAVLIHMHNWATTPLGPISGWSERLKLAVEMVLSAPLVASLVCGPERVLIYNDAAAKLYGHRHPDALGRPLPETFPQGWVTVAPFYERAFAGETVQIGGQPLNTRGEDAPTDVFDALLTPVREADGQVAYIHMTGFEVGDRVRTEAALRESEEKYRTLFDSIDEGFTVVELIRDSDGTPFDLIYRDFNQAFEKISRLASAVLNKGVREVFPNFNAEWFVQYNRILETGIPERSEEYLPDLDRWNRRYMSRIGGPGSPFCAVVFDDISERKRAEIALRESEERQAFLLKFSDALRAEPDADAVANRALKMLLDHLRLDRCYITYYRPNDDEAEFPYQLGNDTVPPLPAKVRLSDFPDAYEQVLDRTFVIEDDFERRGLSEAERANSKALGMRAMVASTVRRGERRPLYSMAAVSSRPRRWSPAEIALVEEAAERTWAAIERTRTETALRESEERFRQFAAASAAGLWIRDADTLAMEFVSPAIAAIYGVAAAVLLGDVTR